MRYSGTHSILDVDRVAGVVAAPGWRGDTLANMWNAQSTCVAGPWALTYGTFRPEKIA
jgi:hypothetical protein